MAGEEKKEKSRGGEFSEDRVASDLRGTNEEKRGFCIPWDFWSRFQAPNLVSKLGKMSILEISLMQWVRVFFTAEVMREWRRDSFQYQCASYLLLRNKLPQNWEVWNNSIIVRVLILAIVVCVVASHCGFALPLPQGWQCGAPFHILIPIWISFLWNAWSNLLPIFSCWIAGIFINLRPWVTYPR